MIRTKLHPIGGVESNGGIDPKWNSADNAKYNNKIKDYLADKNSPVEFSSRRAPGGIGENKDTIEITMGKDEDGDGKIDEAGKYVLTFEDTDNNGKISNADKVVKVMIDGKKADASIGAGAEIKQVAIARYNYNQRLEQLEKYERRQNRIADIRDNELDEKGKLKKDSKVKVTHGDIGKATYHLGAGIKVDVDNDVITGITIGNTSFGNPGQKIEANKTIIEGILDHIDKLINGILFVSNEQLKGIENKLDEYRNSGSNPAEN